MLVLTLLSLALIAQASPLEKRLGCKKIYLIHARGTSEPGDMGMLVGTPFSTALSAKFPGGVESTGLGMAYSSEWIGAVTGALMPTAQPGAKAMAKLAKDSLSKCPETKVVLSGYSQGAEQVHGALKILGADAAKIGAAVTFGDPMNMGVLQLTGSMIGGWGALPSSRAKVFCYAGDPVCGGIGISHLSYASSAGEAASFVAKALGSIGESSASSGGLLSGLAGKAGSAAKDSSSSKGSSSSSKDSKGSSSSSKGSSSSSSSLADMLSSLTSKSNDKGSSSSSSKDSSSSKGSSSSSLADMLSSLTSKSNDKGSSSSSSSSSKDSSSSKGSSSSSSKGSSSSSSLADRLSNLTGKGKDKDDKGKEEKEAKSSKSKGKGSWVNIENNSNGEADMAPQFVTDFTPSRLM